MNRMARLPASNPTGANGATRKVLKGNDGAVPIDIPRDRDGSFEPELIRKGQTRIDGMDDKIIGLYAAGLSTRDIRSHLEEVYGLRVSADLISRVTDAVLEEVSDWQNRALEPVYPIRRRENDPPDRFLFLLHPRCPTGQNS